jgi:peptidoglycan glycosyltransferase
MLAAYLVLLLGATYWQVVHAADVANDPKTNARRMEADAQEVKRGRILDRNGVVLAETVEQPDGTLVRQYSDPGAAHVVGYHSSRYGSSGAEAAADEALRGGGDPESLEDLADDLLHVRKEGEDVRITLDEKLQHAAEQAMGNSPGALVALDPRSGDILAIVSVPGFDPNVSIDDQFEALTSREDSPLLNRATQGLYTPGSTFKTVTLAAALQAGLVNAKTPATCPATIDVLGFPITSHNEPPGKRTTNVADAYAYSCNTYFAQLGIQVGAERLTEMARGFGILDEAPFELPTVAGRLFTTPGYIGSDQGLAVTAFGQGELQVTPLQLALVAAAVANGGMVPKPRLLMSTQPEDWRRAMSPEAAHELASIMEYGVQQGWAATAAVPGVSVAGKTGSAEVAPGESSHAVFIAFAPVDDPKIAIAVLKEHAGAGSVEAGPVVKAVLEAALK